MGDLKTVNIKNRCLRIVAGGESEKNLVLKWIGNTQPCQPSKRLAAI